MKYQVRIGDRIYRVEIEALSVRPIIARVDGVRIEVWPENSAQRSTECGEPDPLNIQYAERLTAPPNTSGAPKIAAAQTKTVNAPIPGVILEIEVAPGDTVELGQSLFVIEAMKMRNKIRSPRPGKIAKIKVVSGQTVNYNDILLEFTE